MRKIGSKRKTFIDSEVGNSKYVVDTDKLDIRFFEEVKENSPQIQETLDKAQEGYAPFPELQQDIFSSLFRYKPRRLKEHQVNSEFLLNYYVMGEVMNSPKYKELRALTRLDRINSTVGTEVLGHEAHEQIKKLKEQMKKLQEQLDAEAAEAQAQQNANKDQGQGASVSKDGKGGKPLPGSPEHTLKEAQKILEEKQKEFQKSMKKKEVKQQIMRMMDRVHAKVVETSNMISNWGLDGDETFQRMPYHEKMALLKRLRNSSKLKQIAELAGRFKRIATQRQREKVKKGMDEIYDVILGSDINRVLPSELMKLNHPVTKYLFYKDWAEGKLPQYELRGKEKKQKGAIVVCIDENFA